MTGMALLLTLAMDKFLTRKPKPSTSRKEQVKDKDSDSHCSGSLVQEDEEPAPKIQTTQQQKTLAMDKFLKHKPKPSTSRQEQDKNKDSDNHCSGSIVEEDEEPAPKRQKKQNREFNDKWLVDITFKNWISKKEQDCGSVTAFCKVCNSAFVNHKPALVKHMQTAKHVQKVNSISKSTPITQVLKPKKEDELKKRAELKICAFLAQHNLPLSLADDFTSFLADVSPDSEIAKSLQLGGTKATNAIKTVLGPIITQELVEKLKETPFSIRGGSP